MISGLFITAESFAWKIVHQFVLSLQFSYKRRQRESGCFQRRH
ncbi:hypothetical protein RBSWK_05779 [Rhodopirellula baltica SWK14]|uniref:Uncharacterized protein n=1 Tax=Rhodopirellula baltica SWK14 TaxID=993516 RepID=L7C7Z9_RHOBT|nr:hypothetical protein RBSWK_05779 [Rhodopirellula baltica SWK14]